MRNVHRIAAYHERGSQLGGDCSASVTQWELPLLFCLQACNRASVVLPLTEHCGCHFDNSHRSDILPSLSAVSPSAAPLIIASQIINIKSTLMCSSRCLAMLSCQAQMYECVKAILPPRNPVLEARGCFIVVPVFVWLSQISFEIRFAKCHSIR